MTNSTSEREQRLKQIRERSESRKRVAGKFQWAQVSTQEWSDIDFLLSLIDSEAAGDPETVAREFIQRYYNEGAWKDKADAWLFNELVATLNSVATSTRSLCVETVRGLMEREVNGHSRGAYQRAIVALESVTLEAAANETREDVSWGQQ